ncbi:hypothetical protein EJV47_25075 [Hymenobacter gummosus]|uniref:Uncharacterized protein n=1 Tax=Hymenobacter gummosus TaxID=1776032 RepID=A0A3S0H2B4_9BACT|nr:hypothetical protein [Hymenobacter gummosus]RTQ45416.1 hypothetical protein EJV47_25075 [Hymenobacter gummosus]
MQQCLALFLTLLILLQSFSREVLVVDYALHRARVTELFCVNKDKPQLQCNGKCHLRKQLRKAAEADKKVPPSLVGKVKYEALPPAQRLLPGAAASPAARPQFGAARTVLYQYNGRGSVFRPPHPGPALVPARAA